MCPAPGSIQCQVSTVNRPTVTILGKSGVTDPYEWFMHTCINQNINCHLTTVDDTITLVRKFLTRHSSLLSNFNLCFIFSVACWQLAQLNAGTKPEVHFEENSLLTPKFWVIMRRLLLSLVLTWVMNFNLLNQIYILVFLTFIRLLTVKVKESWVCIIEFVHVPGNCGYKHKKSFGIILHHITTV